MKRIPFNVSARTARLIGRENISSAEGALIELVKNSYDADAHYCVIYFKDKFSELPLTASSLELSELSNIIDSRKIRICYSKKQSEDGSVIYHFNKSLYESLYKKTERISVEEKLSRSVAIHILDDGQGMVEDTIEKCWMTIGTDNKDNDFISNRTGRIKSGAKGIGRFALDRLGEKCDLLTKTVDDEDTLLWSVDWNDFDKQGITIDSVAAKLSKSDIELSTNLESLLNQKIIDTLNLEPSNHGVHISITQARDTWKKNNISKLYKELETLVPPSEDRSFKLYLISERHPEEFGAVEAQACEDFDYKLSACMMENGNIKIEIHRQELDPEKITPELLARPFFENPNLEEKKLTKVPFSYERSLSELLPGIDEHDEQIHDLVGGFEFYLYFLKRSSSITDSERFLHRKINSDTRRNWLNNNSGIRIFRDNFRVRPYGEVGKSSWDWLGLGRRQAEDPSALRSGRWKVAPNNISGIINISRQNNIGLADKSSREGIQESESFTLFKNLIEALIKEFETDRSSLYKEIYQYTQSKKEVPSDDEFNKKQEDDAEEIARKIFQETKERASEEQDDSTKLAYALLKEKAKAKEADDQLDEMKKENSLLRVFASSGITIASFTHELDGLNARLGSRFDTLAILIQKYAEITEEERAELPKFKNPIHRANSLKKDDEKVKNWIKYSLRTIRKDKRKRLKINLKQYFDNLSEEWNTTLADRQITIKTETDNTASIKAYEIDLDCIFNNLIINSNDAFKRRGFNGQRNIEIITSHTDTHILVNYKDSGPGISTNIKNVQDIFKPAFTTKVNNVGEAIGTGLGMWLIQKTLDEYAGKALIASGPGFSLQMELKK